MPDDPETYLAVLKAAYDYEPQPDADEEIAIKENQVLFLVERVDDDWWKVKPKQDDEAPVGLVPAAYVEQHEYTSAVKALYDYDAANPGELSIKEDEILHVYDKDDAWLLVHSQKAGGRVGFVPETYVEEVGDGSKSAAPATPSIPDIVVPPSPPRPVSTYVDPADRVAATSNKSKADDIQTWSVCEIDKKGKKKKGTLGVGSGAVFFTSESDKAPVQKWQTVHLVSAQIDKDKAKHVLVEIGGPNPANLHFSAGSKDTAEAIMKKLRTSKQLSTPQETLEEPITSPERPRSAAKTVHFDAAAPEIIPDPEDSDEEPDRGGSQEYDPNAAVVLYDFTADGDDELTVTEGEDLIVLESDSDDWWKVKNSKGQEGVVPASYVELRNLSTTGDTAQRGREAALEAEQEAEAQAAAEEKRRQRETEETAKRERTREAARLAEAAAAADKKRRDKERAEREKEREKQERERKLAAQKEEERKSQSSSSSKSNGDTDPPRTSTDRRPPPTDKTRIWKDRSGQFQVEAAFLGYHDRKLRLHKVNGVIIEVPAEKMSPEDINYVEKITASQDKRSESSPAPRGVSDDDEPLATRRRSLRLNVKATQPPQKKKPQVDWFEFFLNAGCDVDDCTRYSDAFQRDKIDQAILGDITEGTMRSLGLREGDIIRVRKHIDTSRPKSVPPKDEFRGDEELARALQEEENSRLKRSPAPNLFAGPNGVLKNNTQRRGRPTPSKTLPPTSVDANAISSASETIKRTGSPSLLSPSSSPPVRAGSVPPISSGFDDDAWTNRPSSAKPLTPTPTTPIQPPQSRTASVPPQPPSEPPTAPAIVETKSAPTPQQDRAGKNGGGLAKTTEDDVFNQLARLASLRTQSPALTSPPASQHPNVSNNPSPSPVIVSPPPGFGSGMGIGNSPVPIGQLQSSGLSLQPQLTAAPSLNGPRGPFAPVPGNQGLLQPLVSTRTGFTGFVPTNPGRIGGGLQPQQNIIPQQTGFVNQPLISNPTGFPTNSFGQTQGLLPQQTGFLNVTGFQSPSPGLSASPAFPLPNFQPTGLLSNPTGFPSGGFGGVQSNPTGFPGFVGGTIPFNPQPPQNHNQNNTTPANVFAQMKAGTFEQNNDSAAQPANKYDHLRTNGLAAQHTGWLPGQGTYGTF